MFVQDGWLLKQSGKAEKVHQYRLKKNYLRLNSVNSILILLINVSLLQIRARVFEDKPNKTAEDATDVPKTERFVREHLSIRRL